MKKNTRLPATFVLTLLSGCMAPVHHPPPSNPADASLAEASFSVSRAISSLSETAQAAHPMADLPAQPDPVTYGMGGLTSIDWAGPVKPLLDEIAQSTDYHLRVLGKEPAIPLMVSVYDKNMKIGEILRDIAWQCGRRATVAVYPEEQVIELRYAQN